MFFFLYVTFCCIWTFMKGMNSKQSGTLLLITKLWIVLISGGACDRWIPK